MKAKAMVLEEFNKPLKLREIEIPELIDDGQMIVEITAAGVCGSDVYMWGGHDPRTPLPIILGHEGVGLIKEIKGNKVTLNGEELKPGDPILWHRGVSCGKCYYCKVAKQPSFCKKRWVYGINRTSAEYPYLLGGYADHIVLSSDTDVFKIPPDVSHESLVSVSCSGSTAIHAFELVPTNFADRVVIQGPGPLGIYSIIFAKYSGASKIIVIGGTKERLELCERAGATHIIDRNETSSKKRIERVMELTEGEGADVVYEMAGSTAAVEEGLKMVRIGGSYVSAGFGEPRGKIEVDCFSDIGRKNLRYQGVWVSDVSHTYKSMEIALKYKDVLQDMVTHRFSLSRATEALEKMKSKEAIKAVIIPGMT